MNVIIKKFGTYIFSGKSHVSGENFFVHEEQSCPQKEGARSPSKTWLFFEAT
jgi:hypothetical protein